MSTRLLSWQLEGGIALIFLVALLELVTLALKRRPALRHALWLAVLIRLLVPATFPWSWRIDDLPRIPLIGEAVSVFLHQSHLVQPSRGNQRGAEPATEPITSPPSGGDFATAASARDSQPSSSSAHAQRSAVSERVATCCIAIWLSGVAVVLCRRVLAILRIRSLVASACPAPTTLTIEVQRISMAMGIRPVDVAVVSTLSSPAIFCLGRPRLLWPSARLNDVSTCRGLLAHELAHIRRRDHWVAWLELFAGCLWWWNPLYWHVRTRLLEAAEMACDAEAVALDSIPRDEYAHLFLDFSRRPARTPEQLTFSLGVVSSNRVRMERRLKMILDHRVRGRVGVFGLVAAALLLAAPLPTFAVNPPQSEPQAWRAILARLEALQSLIVAYDRTTTYTPAMSKEEIRKLNDAPEVDGMKTMLLNGTDEYAGTFRVLHGLVRYDEDLVKTNMFNPMTHTIQSRLSGRVECFYQNVRYDRSVSDPVPDIQIDRGLGLRMFDEPSTWLTPELIKKFELDLTDSNLAVLRRRRWEGTPRLEISDEWRFDRRLGYALTSYRRLYNGQLAEEASSEDFRDVKGIRLPGRITYRECSLVVKFPHDIQTTILRIKSYALNDPKNTPQSYPIDRAVLEHAVGGRIWH